MGSRDPSRCLWGWTLGDLLGAEALEAADPPGACTSGYFCSSWCQRRAGCRLALGTRSPPLPTGTQRRKGGERRVGPLRCRRTPGAQGPSRRRRSQRQPREYRGTLGSQQCPLTPGPGGHRSCLTPRVWGDPWVLNWNSGGGRRREGPGRGTARRPRAWTQQLSGPNGLYASPAPPRPPPRPPPHPPAPPPPPHPLRGLPRFASGGSAEHRVLQFRVQDQGQPRPQEQTPGQEAAL